MNHYDPDELFSRWNREPRSITMEQAIRQLMRTNCEQEARLQEQEERHHRQLALLERAIKALENKAERYKSEEIEALI